MPNDSSHSNPSLVELVAPPALPEAGLNLIPAAALAPIVYPPVIVIYVSVVGIVLNPRFLAGSAAAATACRTEDMIVTIGVGMGDLWVIPSLVG